MWVIDGDGRVGVSVGGATETRRRVVTGERLNCAQLILARTEIQSWTVETGRVHPRVGSGPVWVRILNKFGGSGRVKFVTCIYFCFSLAAVRLDIVFEVLGKHYYK